jgi:predicted MPP superfamily phosphohydrolase
MEYRSFSLLHLSDLHFGAEDDDKVNAVVKLAEDQKPDLICVTGDIVDFPKKGRFVRAKNFFDRLRHANLSGLCLIPGNHDAFLRGLSLRKFRKHLNSDTEYHRHFSIREMDVCIFGVDSTCFGLWDASNAGRFSSRSAQNLSHSVARMSNDLGRERFARASKICLIHHHPLPTLSGNQEKMLYLRNSGLFLNAVSENQFDLILHGHQHEPFYFALTYNRGGEKNLVVLSAGTSTKKTTQTTGLDTQTQVHLLEIFEGHDRKMNVYCYNYDFETKRFWLSRVIEQGTSGSKYSYHTQNIKYSAHHEGYALRAVEKRVIASAVGRTISEIPLQFGVDEGTPGADFAALNFQISQEGAVIPTDNIRLALDEPKRKGVVITLPRPADDKGTTLDWSYVWPEGFKRLFLNGKDDGVFPMPANLDRFEVQFEIESLTHQISQFRARYHGNVDTVPQSAGVCGFAIERPTSTWVASFEVEIRKISG